VTDEIRPAWSREGALLTLPGAPRLDELTPEWAWGGADGGGVRVAVIDSGIDAGHPLLGDCVATDEAVAFSVGADGDVVTTPGPHDDSFGHGTACAGIIHSIAPAARVTSVKVLGVGLKGKSAAFLAGLRWAVEEGFDVINLSLGTRRRDWALAFHDVCNRAYFGGSFVVTAANNVQRRSYPSLYASVTSVACNLGDDPLRFHYNPEPPTEFLARGIGVEVAWLAGETIRTTGNSYAAPHIAGIAALVRSKHPSLRPFQLKTVLWATSANVREATGPEIAAAETAGKLSNAIARTPGAPPSSLRAG
jgi:subtilisin family serine protease